jgi:hypothetical protein
MSNTAASSYQWDMLQCVLPPAVLQESSVALCRRNVTVKQTVEQTAMNFGRVLMPGVVRIAVEVGQWRLGYRRLR